MDAARLNFSHGTHQDHQRAAGLIRSAASALKKKVSVIQDLQGIKIRVTDFPDGNIIPRNGQELLVCPGRSASSDKCIFITYPRLLRDF
jgi:pyruvate kinase